jgi:hypothetical protein
MNDLDWLTHEEKEGGGCAVLKSIFGALLKLFNSNI